jgi:hypothetical protein
MIGSGSVFRGAVALSFLLSVLSVIVGCTHEEPKRPPITEGAVNPVGGGSGSGGGGASPDAASQGDGGDDTDGGDGGRASCASVVIAGAVIDLLAVADNPPPGLGGNLGEGTYDVTEARLYAGLGSLPGPTNSSYQGSIRVTGQSFERAIIYRGPNGSTTESRSNGGFIVGGVNGNATIALTCPGSSSEAVTYTVTGNNVTITDNSSKVSLTFSKRL